LPMWDLLRQEEAAAGLCLMPTVRWQELPHEEWFHLSGKQGQDKEGVIRLHLHFNVRGLARWRFAFCGPRRDGVRVTENGARAHGHLRWPALGRGAAPGDPDLPVHAAGGHGPDGAACCVCDAACCVCDVACCVCDAPNAGMVGWKPRAPAALLHR
jgi:hypothetical protein